MDVHLVRDRLRRIAFRWNSVADCTQFVKADPRASLPPFLRCENPRKPSATRARAACTTSIRVELLRRVTESFREVNRRQRSIPIDPDGSYVSASPFPFRNYPASTLRASLRIDVGILPAISSRYWSLAVDTTTKDPSMKTLRRLIEPEAPLPRENSFRSSDFARTAAVNWKARCARRWNYFLSPPTPFSSS